MRFPYVTAQGSAPRTYTAQGALAGGVNSKQLGVLLNQWVTTATTARFTLTPVSEQQPQRIEETMLEQLLRLYTTFMSTGVTSPMPHFVGPPGSGKSTVFQQLADLLDVNLHVVNVSRISPLGLEGLEMPDKDNTGLRLLISELWTKAEEGDIYLFDEFLRGFPEVYNGLLDIFTGREVAGYELPRVFIAGASNSVATYDAALEDRLLHIPVPDPRKRKTERNRLAKMLVDDLGLFPEVVATYHMDELMDQEVLPTFDMLDRFSGKGSMNASASMKGSSMRKLIGQAKLRQFESEPLMDLIAESNRLAMLHSQPQFVLLMSGSNVPRSYESRARQLLQAKPEELTEVQWSNLHLNLQLIEMERAKVAQASATEEKEEEDIYVQSS